MTVGRWRGRCRQAGLAVWPLVVIVALSAGLRAQAPPDTVDRIAVAALAGDWYEIATTGSFWHRQCLSNTRYRFTVRGSGGLAAGSTCTTARGTEVHRGRLRQARDGDGRLSIRFAPVIFAWLPAAWSDFWILAMADEPGWLLVGDNHRDRLALLARHVVLDEASVARALAAARQAGYDLSGFAFVPHPAGATGLPLPLP